MSGMTKKSKLIHEHRQLKHLLLSAALEEAGAPKVILKSIMVTGAILLCVMIWAIFTQIPEVASAPGSVVPRGQIPIVQHLEGGVVAKVLVHDGEQIEAGMPVFLMSPTLALSELKKLHNHQTALAIDLIRIESFIEGKKLTISDITNQVKIPKQMREEDYQKIIQNAISLSEQHQISAQREKSILKKKIAQYTKDNDNLISKMNNIKSKRANLKSQVDIHEKGTITQTSSTLNLLQAKDRYANVVTDYLEAENLIATNKNALSEAKDRYSNLEATLLEEAYTEKSQISKKLLEANDSLAATQEKVERLTVFSPVKGIIKGLTIDVGSVIPPGGVVFEVVPLDETLIVEARVKPEDIGHVEIGAPVKIKISAFNFSRYGQITGILEKISPSTFLDENGQPYYKTMIHLDKTFVGDNENRNRILPGMTVTADIMTGTKSLMSYLLKPVQTTLSESFRER